MVDSKFWVKVGIMEADSSTAAEGMPDGSGKPAGRL